MKVFTIAAGLVLCFAALAHGQLMKLELWDDEARDRGIPVKW